MKKILIKLIALCLVICSTLTLFVGCGAGAVDNREVIELGVYPQTRVSEAESQQLTDAVGDPTLLGTAGWRDYGYIVRKEKRVNQVDVIEIGLEGAMYYRDVTTASGDRYRGVYIKWNRTYNWYEGKSTSVDSWQDNCGYYREIESVTDKGIYWFKYEPIKWTVVAEDAETGLATLVSQVILDSQPFQDGYFDFESKGIKVEELKQAVEGTVGANYLTNNYKNSDVRSWLNGTGYGTFYRTAFSNSAQKEERSFIVNTEIENNLSDRFFLLSYDEALEYYGNKDLRKKATTDYAQSQGAYTYIEDPYEDNYGGLGVWWLRSPDENSSKLAQMVRLDGETASSTVSYTQYGVVPAMRVKISDVREYLTDKNN